MAVILGPGNRLVDGRAYKWGAQRWREGQENRERGMRRRTDGGPRGRPKEGQRNREERGMERWWRGT